MSPQSGSGLATRPFILLIVATTLAYGNQWVLTPVIPLYVQELGGSAFVAGLALLAFAVPSFSVRPLVGRIADRWSAAGVLAIGLAMLGAATLLLLVPMLSMVFIGNILRGLSWAGVNTGAYTTLAIVSPPERRGEAAGYFSSALTGASIVFPAIGLWLIAGPGGYRDAFLIATLFALAGPLFAVSLARMQSGARQAPPATEAAGGSLIDRGVLLATGLNLCTSLVAPALMAFLPLYARSLGIGNIEWFYVIAGATSILVRPILGRHSDAVGRGPAIGFGLGAQLFGLVLIILADGLALILIGGFFASLGTALIGSSATALAMDLVDPRHRGRGMATFSMSFQLGAGVGALISGALADLTGLRSMYYGALAITVVGFFLLASAWSSLPRPGKAD